MGMTVWDEDTMQPMNQHPIGTMKQNYRRRLIIDYLADDTCDNIMEYLNKVDVKHTKLEKHYSVKRNGENLNPC